MQSISVDGRKFSPSKIMCVGRNYNLHIQEMGGKGLPKEPVIFIKPNSSLAFNPSEIFIPEALGLLHYEVELCFVVGKTGFDIPLKKAKNYIAGFAVGIDFTLRDRQAIAKQRGEPWSLAKGFDMSAPLGRFVMKRHIEDYMDLDIMLTVNDEVRQSGNTIDMIFSPQRILSFTSKFMMLEKGDVFMTGTPRGVGEAKHGDRLFAEISNLPPLEFTLKRK